MNAVDEFLIDNETVYSSIMIFFSDFPLDNSDPLLGSLRADTTKVLSSLVF